MKIELIDYKYMSLMRSKLFCIMNNIVVRETFLERYVNSFYIK